MELNAFNIKVSVIEPGPVITEFFEVVREKVDQNIKEPENSPYEAAFVKIKAIEDQVSMLGWTPEKVAQVIVRSLVDPNPSPRYVAATGGEIMLFLMTKVLPTWAKDAFWKRFYGIDQVEKEWKQK